MKKTFKLSVPYLGKAVVVTVVSFSCAISAYQLYQNSSVFSPQSQALDLKNNQVVFSNQNQQTNTNQNQDESQYLNENQQALDKISQTNLNNSPYLFKNQGRVDPTKIYGQTGMGTNGGNTIGVNPNGTTNNGNVTVVIPGTGMPIATGDASSGIANDEVNKNTNHETTPIVDPDPEPTLPDLSNNEIYKDAISLPNTGIEQKENANYNIHFMAAEDLYLDNLTMLYDGCVITPWKLLCNMVVMISERKEGDSYPTLYRIENYNDNFKIGSYPQYATENFKVSFYFRLNESSPWQEYIYEFKVDYQARISLQDYNQQEIKYFYLKKDETEDLRKYYNLIIPTYQDSTQMFIGWKEEDGSVIEDQSDYTITQKGRITLVPQEMIDLPEGYIVQLQDKTIFLPIFATIYEYAFTNYVGDLNADIHVPDGIKKVELNDIFGKEFNGDFYISEIVDDISFGYGWTGPDLYGKYIVDENNPIFSSNEDGLLMDKSQTVILQTPIADAIYIPEGVTSISSSISWYVHDIYFEGKCLIDSHSFSNIPTDSTVHVPDQYYLDYFKKSYGSFVTSIVNENNESYDYTVSNNLVFSDDEKILVSTLDSASGTIVIPETVEKIADQAFSGNSDITQIILTEGNIELGHQIFKDSGVEEVMILTQDMPSVYKDTFSDSDNLKGISIARNYYHLYESKWSDLLEPTEFALLNETDSSLNVKDGFEYLEMYYRDRAHVTILLNAPSDLVYFDEDSIPGVIITEIGKNAFSNCKQLKSVKLSKQVVQIDSYAFYGCDDLEGIFSANTDTITIQENALEITDGFFPNLRYIALNAKNANFENYYLPSTNQKIFVPYNGEGYNVGNTYSSEYFLDESYGGAILYGYARGSDQDGNTITVDNEFYLISATSDTRGAVATKEGTFEICMNAFEGVPITSIQLNMTDDMYWIDDYAFYGTKLEGELTLPDGLGPIGMAAFSDTSLTKVTFPKVYGNNAEHPAWLWTNSFGSTLKEVVFQNATPILLYYYGDGNGFEFGQDLADDFHVTLSGDATGLEQTYIDNWKYSFAGYDILDAQIHENEIKEAEKKVAALLNYVVPETNKNQNLNNQIGEPDTQTKDDQQEIQTENNQEQDDSNNNQQEALENGGEENDN